MRIDCIKNITKGVFLILTLLKYMIKYKLAFF